MSYSSGDIVSVLMGTQEVIGRVTTVYGKGSKNDYAVDVLLSRGGTKHIKVPEKGKIIGAVPNSDTYVLQFREIDAKKKKRSRSRSRSRSPEKKVKRKRARSRSRSKSSSGSSGSYKPRAERHGVRSKRLQEQIKKAKEQEKSPDSQLASLMKKISGLGLKNSGIKY